MHLIFLPHLKNKIEDREIYHHVIDVLRKKEGEEILFTDGKGKKFKAQIEKIDKKKKIFEIKNIEVIGEKLPTYPFINLFCAIPKKNKFELLVEKATELGADIIFPLKCKNQQKLDLNFNRIMKIAQQATAQSGRLILPKISKPIDFRKALDFVGNLNSSINILFSLNEESKDFNSVISGLNKYKNINLFIGPEGDFSESEIELAKQKGFLLCKLSMNILRTETAGIFLTGLLSFLFKR